MVDTPTHNTEDYALKFWQEFYAGLMKQAKDLQEQRAAVLQQASVIRQYCIDRRAGVTVAVPVDGVESKVIE